jgi:hypothetical protein
MTITLRDFTHASKIFRGGNYAKAPKLKFLFHVYFALNENSYNNGTLGPLASDQPFGVLVKTVKLPSFQVTAQELNQYNRKRIVQTKIKYENIDITFHDDSSNLITGLWNQYYTYYYKDSLNYKNMQFIGSRGYTPPESATTTPESRKNIYSSDINDSTSWGYIGETTTQSAFKKAFFKYITIFGFNQHKFTSYTLVNPIINRLNHDTYNYSEGGGTMEIGMNIGYETVIYNQGAMDGQDPQNIVTGFGLEANYDKTLSPITKPGENRLVQMNDGTVPANGGFIIDSITQR